MPFKKRLQGCREKLNEQKIDRFITFNSVHIRYLTGFTGSNGALLIDPKAATLMTDARYDEQAHNETHDVAILISEAGKTLSETLARSNLIAEGERVGFETSHVTVWQFDKLRERMAAVTWTPTTSFVESVRRKKTPAEVDFIKRAIHITEYVLEQILTTIRPGLSENDLALDIDHRLRIEGAERSSFDTIVAFGDRSALPHARPTDRKLSKNENILFDFGAVVHGYHADMTRTIFFGKPGSEFQCDYQSVLRAQQAAIGFARAGTTCCALDQVARDELKRKDLSSFFVHSLGHGIGLEIHEAPTISAASTESLQTGDVVTIEPGVYRPGRYGIRIENDVWISERGPVDLMQTSTNMINLEN